MVDRLRAYSVFLVICIVLALNFWFGIYTAEASTSAMLVSSDKNRATHQTFREDTRLTNSCIESGKSKAHCICVTSIYKHRFSQRDYKAAVSLYIAEQNAQPKTLKATHTGTDTAGYSTEEIGTINTKRRELLSDQKFQDRCREAANYFKS